MFIQDMFKLVLMSFGKGNILRQQAILHASHSDQRDICFGHLVPLSKIWKFRIMWLCIWWARILWEKSAICNQDLRVGSK